MGPKLNFLLLALSSLQIISSTEGYRLHAFTPPECPTEGEHFFPDPENCEKYFHCAFGVPHHKQCPAGTFWNQNILACDLEENVECNNTTPITTANPPETTTRVSTNPSTTTVPPPVCPPIGIISKPVEGNCKAYILCVHGEPFYRECADGTLFDPIELICKLEGDVDCTPSTPRPTPIPTQMPTDYPETPSTLKPWEPSTSESWESSSPKPTTNFPTTLNPIDFPCPAVDFIYMPHKYSCNLFYWCIKGFYNGTSNCGESLWFGFLPQACVSPWESECTLEPRPSTPAGEEYIIH